MRFLISATCLLLFLATNLQGQAQSFMSITVTEDLRILSANRSFILITEADGTQKQTDLQRTVGTNIKIEGVNENEKKIVETLNIYAQKGWKILSVNSVNLQSGETTWLVTTRYILEKKSE